MLNPGRVLAYYNGSNMIPDNHTTSSNREAEFVSLLTANQRKLFAYIMSLVVHVNDADDILQETVQVMLRKFDQFERGTDFLAWATTIAHYRVFDFRKRKAKNELIFDDEIFNRLQHQAHSELQDTDEYLDSLKVCMQKLTTKDLGLLKLRYMSGIPVREIASRYGRNLQSVYRSIARIQSLLRRCIKRQLAS